MGPFPHDDVGGETRVRYDVGGKGEEVPDPTSVGPEDGHGLRDRGEVWVVGVGV